MSYRTRVRVMLLPAVLSVFLVPEWWPGRPDAQSTRAGIAWGQASEYEGFGASTPGGSDGSVVHVTNLNDSGPGSLREAVAGGNRTVVFDVGGIIELESAVYMTGAFVTIDGFTAPVPGITLRGGALVIRGNDGAHDVIVRGLRVRDAPLDGIQIAYGAYNVVIDHVSIHGSGDGNLDITEGSHDVTVSWSILAAPTDDKNMLIKYGASRITLHHNLFVDSSQRNPIVSTDDAGTPATDTTADIRNNLIRNWGLGVGAMIFKGAYANVVANFTSSPTSSTSDQAQGVVVCDFDCEGDPTAVAWAHVSGNLSGDAPPVDFNAEGNVLDPFPIAFVATQNAYTAAQEILAQAGVRPLDAIDEQTLGSIVLSPPPAGPNLTVSFLALTMSGSQVTITDRTTNGGTGQAGSSNTKFFLSVNSVLDSSDVLVASRSIGPLAPEGSSAGSLTVSLPLGTMVGTYVLIARADADNEVSEPNEADNVTARAITIAIPDLIVSSLSAPGTAAPGDSISVAETTRNQSAIGASIVTTTRFFLSTDSVLDAGDALLGYRSVLALAGGASSAGSTQLIIPSTIAVGPYFILARADADDEQIELNEANNVSARALTVSTPPTSGTDLVIEASSLSASSVVAGGSTTASYRVANRGTVAVSATYTDKLYLSADATLDAGDVLLGTSHGHTADLAPNATHEHSQAVTIPGATAPGSRYILVQADALGAVAEGNEINNVAAIAVTATAPPPSTKDLVIAGLALSKATVAAGGSLTVSYSVKNQGTTKVTETYTERIYLSSDAVLGTDDTLLGTSHGHTSDLVANATHGHSQSVTIPAGIALGGHFILVRADALAAVSEADEANNVTATGLTVTAPPPSGKDLVIEGLGLSAGSVAPGGSLMASYRVVNRGTVKVTATYTDRLYFSIDATLDASDVLLGTSHGHTSDLSINATHSHSQSIAVPAGTAPGSSFILVQADALGAVLEVNEANNVTAVPLTVTGP